MRIIADVGGRFLLNRLTATSGLLLVGFSLIACSQEKPTPVAIPYEGAPVTAAIDDETLVIANNSENTIYHMIFPTDILPVIEWAPCIAPESCPAEQMIDSGGEKRFAIREIVGVQTESITVFWWIYLEKQLDANVPPIEMDEITVPLP